MKNHSKLTFGERLKQIRKEQNLKQEYMAAKLEMKQPNYSHIENNKVKPNLQQLKKIAEIFSISMENLVGDSAINIENFTNNISSNNMSGIDFVIHQQILDSKNLIIQVQENKIKELIREKEYLLTMYKNQQNPKC
ncbi:helix-turn-helix protein [Arcicella aurantiaca]|uniref:Helix-turn-helix protein n=1 Tax=Arcicella aurantiaca TaxID=591202 RepID=A0A316DJD5_9BACT|nr:helix-turn-helix domain-containing protein [Arcicella aurantiaca]PWK17602.1 helix-turn-helix protein [Arcicella aurantiaca]